MHDATSRMESMHHVNRTMCHEEDIHCVNRGLGHMGMEEKDMAMHEGPINDQILCACVHVGIHEGNHQSQRLDHMNKGYSPYTRRRKSSKEAPTQECTF